MLDLSFASPTTWKYPLWAADRNTQSDNTASANDPVTTGSKMFSSRAHMLTGMVIAGLRRSLSLVLGTLSLIWFVLPRRGRPANFKAAHQLHPMAYLDALRGYFALMIFTRHFMAIEWRWLPQFVVKTPILQFPFRGASVALNVFFFISGYVITFKSIGLMQTKQYDKLIDTLSSAIFRRYLRLFLPVLGTTFVTIILVKLGIAQPPIYKQRDLAGNPLTYFIRDSFQALDPTKSVGGWNIDPYSTPGSQLLGHFWSIRTEFRSSMMLYLFCVGTCKLSIKQRKRLTWMFIVLFTYWQANWAAMAFLGVWFGERRKERNARAAEQLKLLTHSPTIETPAKGYDGTVERAGDAFEKGGQSSPEESKFWPSSGFKQRFDGVSNRLRGVTIPSRLREYALVAMFLFAFAIWYEPYQNQTSTRIIPRTLRAVTPKHWDSHMKQFFQMMVGAFCMLYSVDLMPALQKPLLKPFSQFLGELSFGIYAVQYTVAWCVWPRFLTFAAGRYGKYDWDKFMPMFPGWIGMTILLLWAAEVFRRCDVHVVKFCSNLEKRLFMPR